MDSSHVLRLDHSFRYTGSLEIVVETMRILRYSPIAFIAIWALVITPVSTIYLSNMLVDQSLVERVTIRLVLIAKSSGVPSNAFVKQCCHNFSEFAISSIVSFPLYVTLLLIAKAAVVYSIECTYSRKKFDLIKFYVIMRTIWRRVISTYLLICAINVGCVTLFTMLLICVSRMFYVIGFSLDSILYINGAIGLCFSVFMAHTIIICDLSLVISVLEEVYGTRALLRSNVYFRGQTQVGLIIFIGSTIGMAVVKGLFEHRMKSLSFEDESSRIWERPLLVIIYSFLVLIDFMMSTIFYFSCKSYSLEGSIVECKQVFENESISLAYFDDK